MFPTSVGMNRPTWNIKCLTLNVSHERGDEPPKLKKPNFNKACFPRAWGWTATTDFNRLNDKMFPTSVGMNRNWFYRQIRIMNVSHERGDEPLCVHICILSLLCFPRAWGWTVGKTAFVGALTMFPTSVGMNRKQILAIVDDFDVSHERGDEP